MPHGNGKEVNTTNTRIKKLRKALDLTQEEFGKRIGVKRNTVATYEIGRNTPIDAVISNICREFNVNETWLRTGAGEMFRELSRDQELANFFGDVLRGESDDFRKRFISMLSRLDTTDWEALERMAAKLVARKLDGPPEWWEAPAEMGKPISDTPHVPPGYSSRAELEAEADEFAAMAREQFLSEKIPGYRASFVNGYGDPGGGKPA